MTEGSLVHPHHGQSGPSRFQSFLRGFASVEGLRGAGKWHAQSPCHTTGPICEHNGLSDSSKPFNCITCSRDPLVLFVQDVVLVLRMCKSGPLMWLNLQQDCGPLFTLCNGWEQSSSCLITKHFFLKRNFRFL